MLPDGLRGFTLRREKALYFATAYRPREEVSLAHELAHHFEPEGLRPEAVEEWCTRVAAALVLPRTCFLVSLVEHRFSVPALRRRWRNASWELIVLRIADLCPGIAAAAWVDDALKWRSHRSEAAVTPAEHAAVSDARRRGRGLVLADSRLAAAWSLAPRGARFRAVSICVPAT